MSEEKKTVNLKEDELNKIAGGRRRYRIGSNQHKLGKIL